ncbi:MAG: response regulator transcription factor [Planctomycetota bacterium]
MTAPSAADGKLVLIVDDERDLVELVTHNLNRNGYRTIAASDGRSALAMARSEQPDLIVLDVMMPNLDGHEVARRLKAEPSTATIPIIMLTAKAEETDEIVGLKIGADDYVTKPFSMKVLMARMESVLRRGGTDAGSENESQLKAGPLLIDHAKHEVFVNERQVKLTLTEFKLLAALVEAGGRVLSRDRLMDKAMGTDVFVTDRAIDVHVTAIRKKLGDASWLVHTVRGVGYRLQDSSEDAG